VIVLWLLGAAATSVGFALVLRRRQDLVVRAEVVANRTAGERAPVIVQQTTVVFRDPDGEDVRVAVRTRVVLAPGAAVRVRYRRGDLAHARVEHVRADLVLLGVGLGAFAAAGLPAPAGFLLAGGGLFGAIGGWMLRPMVGGVKVRGTVVRVDRKQDDDGDTLWRPVVRYFDREERERVVEYDVWTNGRAPQVGAPQLLWYRPEDPARILLGAGIALGGIMAGVGACLAVAALVVLAAR
jgi:hypothetical protein